MSKIQTIIDTVKELSVIELSELVKAFEEEFGVSAAAPVAVAVAGGAAAAVVAVAALMNATSKARSKGNERAIDILAQQALVERQSRESWQDKHSPSTVQYVDVQTGAGAFSNANAAAAAEEFDLGKNYVAGANIAGFKKVVDAMNAQGIV